VGRLAGGDASVENSGAQVRGNAGAIVRDGEQCAGRRLEESGAVAVRERAMDVPALRRDVDLATGGHGVRGIADEVDHDPGEVFDGEADGRHGGRGGERNLDGGPGDGGQQRVHPAQLGWEVGDRKSARSGWRWSRVGRRQGQDLFHERGGVLGHAFELGGEVAVLRTEDAGGGEQMTVEQEAGEDVAEVMGEAFKTLWLRRGGVGRGCGTGGVDFDKGARSASGPGGCSGRGTRWGRRAGVVRRAGIGGVVLSLKRRLGASLESRTRRSVSCLRTRGVPNLIDFVLHTKEMT
jgi:hypothetical protein